MSLALDGPETWMFMGYVYLQELLRAEIEAVRSGSELEVKVKSLEGQISEHEAESSRLLRLIEVQKETATNADQNARRRLDEATKELSARVGFSTSTEHKCSD